MNVTGPNAALSALVARLSDERNNVVGTVAQAAAAAAGVGEGRDGAARATAAAAAGAAALSFNTFLNLLRSQLFTLTIDSVAECPYNRWVDGWMQPIPLPGGAGTTSVHWTLVNGSAEATTGRVVLYLDGVEVIAAARNNVIKDLAAGGQTTGDSWFYPAGEGLHTLQLAYVVEDRQAPFYNPATGGLDTHTLMTTLAQIQQPYIAAGSADTFRTLITQALGITVTHDESDGLSTTTYEGVDRFGLRRKCIVRRSLVSGFPSPYFDPRYHASQGADTVRAEVWMSVNEACFLLVTMNFFPNLKLFANRWIIDPSLRIAIQGSAIDSPFAKGDPRVRHTLSAAILADTNDPSTATIVALVNASNNPEPLLSITTDSKSSAQRFADRPLLSYFPTEIDNASFFETVLDLPDNMAGPLAPMSVVYPPQVTGSDERRPQRDGPLPEDLPKMGTREWFAAAYVTLVTVGRQISCRPPPIVATNPALAPWFWAGCVVATGAAVLGGYIATHHVDPSGGGGGGSSGPPGPGGQPPTPSPSPMPGPFPWEGQCESDGDCPGTPAGTMAMCIGGSCVLVILDPSGDHG